MRVVLVGPEIEENLALAYLKSSLVLAGNDCSIVAFNHESELRSVTRKILNSKPELVGFSLVAQRRYSDFQRLAQMLRGRGFTGHITAGGHFAGLRAGEVLLDSPGIDSIIHHDGEERIVALTTWSDFCGEPPRELDGITWRTPDGSLRHRPPRLAVDVDGVAFPVRRRPDRTLGFARAPMVTSRGCSGACSFCSIHAWHRQVPAGRLRFRAPEKVAHEMVDLYNNHNVRVFIFHDDDFIHPNRTEAMRRCGAIFETAEHSIDGPFAFVMKCRPDSVNEQLFRYLKSKGLVRVYVGIETNSAIGIRTLNRRTTKQVNERALAILRDLDIYGCFNLLIFHPDSTLEELEENLGFLETNVGFPFDIARTELYARSSLEERMIREGRARGDYRGYDYRIDDPTAETTFRMFADVLWERHFGQHSILQRVQDLGFRFSLLQRFYPSMASRSLQFSVGSLIREVNSDTIKYMRRLISAAPSASGTLEGVGYKDLAGGMRLEIANRIRQQSVSLAVLSLELDVRAVLGRFGMAPRSFGIEWPRIPRRIATTMPSVALALSALYSSRGCKETTVCDPPPPPTLFSSQIAPHLNKECAVSGCHSAATGSANLILTNDSSYSNLVGKSSTEVPRLKRVIPFQADSSYLVHKLLGTQQSVGGTGDRMPRGGQPDSGFIQTVWEWISNGAGKD